MKEKINWYKLEVNEYQDDRGMKIHKEHILKV
jgi:hypothetical protein